MKVFTCSHCNNPLYFENNTCLSCQHTVGFDAERLSLVTLEKTGDNQYKDITDPGKVYRLCENAAHGTCNWLVPAAQESNFCRACALNRTIPMLSSPENLDRWRRIEIAKHRLVYSLLKLKLPFFPKAKLVADPATGQLPPDTGPGIAFDF
ncbi:MAG: zinc-ribbon domain-containing protein, partial [Bacteroidetes bacterium]|nr:zinc-ribbon domain-containing protein [Bacteroidota bacterium]